MLQIGPRIYQLVRAQSGFHVSIDLNANDPLHRQMWRLETHFVPADEDAGPWPNWEWEYWRVTINPMAFFRVSDWRELARGSFFEGADADRFMLWCAIENLIRLSVSPNQERSIAPGDFRAVRRDGYLFTCEFDGEITPTKEDMEKDPGAVPVEFRMMEEIPFATVTVAVPLNAADPLSAARGIAEREIGLKEVARSRVSLFDPTRKVWKPEKSGKHTVTLETPWRVAG